MHARSLTGPISAIAAWASCLCLLTSASAKEETGESPPQRLEFGVVFQAKGGVVKNVTGTVTVPDDWPGQQRVKVVEESLPGGASVSYKKTEDVGRQMVVKIPSLAPGREYRAVVTFEIQRLTPPPLPEDVDRYAVPPRGKAPAAYLAPSPRIESDAPEVRKAAEEAVAGQEKAWDRVKAIHAWVHQNIKYAGGLENTQGVVATLASRQGVCAEKNSLAVALLRAVGIPARLVRIPRHCYYEVYLLDGEGQGHWLSGDASASPTIAPSAAARGVILQKGDNVAIIDPATKRRSKGRFLAETATGVPQSRGATVSFQPISPALGPPLDVSKVK